nr:3-isopropylmalate dehydratase large subunit [Gammaproteobacteria bacterium]
MGKTLFEKIWDTHVVGETGGWSILYVDRHLGHDGSSRALDMLRRRGLSLRRPDKTMIVFDHVIPTKNQHDALTDPKMVEMLDTVREFADRYGMKNVYDVTDVRNGISHVVGPEQGFSLPGATLVCGDSHTATHGAFGALAFGIGASEVEHVFGTQTLLQLKPKSMRIDITGTLPDQVYAKDIILAIIGHIGTGGGTGCVIEYAGEAMEQLSMEGRMTVCNMTIEAGARAGLIAPDQTTFDYLKGRPLAPSADAWQQAVEYWKTLPSDDNATFDQSAALDISSLAPQVTWGTN